MTQLFVESCVDFEVAHLSVLMVWRLPYPEIPTLNAIACICQTICDVNSSNVLGRLVQCEQKGWDRGRRVGINVKG